MLSRIFATMFDRSTIIRKRTETVGRNMKNERNFVDNPRKMYPTKRQTWREREGQWGERVRRPHQESRKLRLRTSVRSASERHGTGLERNRRLLQRASANAGKGRQDASMGQERAAEIAVRKAAARPWPGARLRKNTGARRRRAELVAVNIPDIRLYLSVLWECNRCNEHGHVLADALNSHSGRAITYETLSLQRIPDDPYRACIERARIL